MADMHKRVRYVCGRCGSSNVLSDARAQCDARKQEWVVIGHYDSSECSDCGREDRIIEVELARA